MQGRELSRQRTVAAGHLYRPLRAVDGFRRLAGCELDDSELCLAGDVHTNITDHRA